MGRHGLLEERASLGYRLFFPVPGIYFLIGTVVYFDGGSDLPFSAGIFAMGLALTAGPFRPLVRVDGDSLLLRGFLLQRKVPLASVTGVQSTYGGLEVAYGDGEHFQVPLIGETMNLTRWRRRTSRGDALADRILDLR